eukprot:gene46849-57361_t
MEEDLALQYNSLSLADNIDSYNDDAANHLASLVSEQGTCNLIVNYLPHDVDDLALRALFQEFGEILMTKVVRDKNTKKSMGYGFVKFMHETDALIAIEKMNGYTL